MIKDKSVLRKWDLISSVILIIFSLLIIFESLKMPIGNNVINGVKREWFTSPALMPLIVGTAILLMSISLMIIAIKDGAFKLIRNHVQKKGNIDMEQTYKSLTIYYGIFGFVFFLISYIDYYLSVMLFLSYFITLCYVDNKKLWSFLSRSYVVFTLGFYVLRVMGVFLRYKMFSDILAFLFIGWILMSAIIRTKRHENNRKKTFIGMGISLLMSSFVCSVFTFVLMVTPPRQGGIIMERAEMINASFKNYIRGDNEHGINLDEIELDDIESSSEIDINLLLGN